MYQHSLLRPPISGAFMFSTAKMPWCLIKVLHLLELLHLDWGLSEEISDILRGHSLDSSSQHPLESPAYSVLTAAPRGQAQASVRASRVNQFLLALLSAQLVCG